MALDWQADKSRAYNHLQRIGIPKPKHRGHRHTQSLTQLSNLSPIPSLSSIATATSTTLDTPTSTESFNVFQPKEEDDLTPTPSPKTSRVRTPTTPLSKGKPLGRSDSLKSIASLSSAGSSLIRRLSLKSSASRSEALKTPPPRAQLAKPQSVTAHTPMASTSTCTQRASSFDSERIGVRSGETSNAFVDRDACGAYNLHHSPSKRASLDNKPSTTTHPTRRRQHSESMPSTPLRNHSYSSASTSASKPSSSHKSTQPSAVPTPVRPPSRSEHLLRTTLLKDDIAVANNVNSITANDNARPTTPTSSSSSHRRSQSHSSSNRSTSTSRREAARDSELIASSFLFRTNVSSATLPPPSSPAVVLPTPRRSVTSISTPTPARTTKPLFGFMVDSSDDGDDDSSQGSGPYTYAQQPQRRNQHQPGIMHSPWDVDEYRQYRDTRPTHAPAQRPDGFTHGRSQSYTQLPPAPRPPLTPHEQMLRARLERVLSAGNVAATSKGKGRELDWDGEEERFEDYIGNVGLTDRADGRRKRSSLPVTARDQERERDGSISGLFLGWLWRGGPAEAEQESPQSYTQGNPQLPTPSTPRESRDGYMSQTYSPYHSPGRSRSHTAPAPSSPSQSRFLNNPALVHPHTSPSSRTSQSQSPNLSSSPSIAAAAGFVHLSPNANGNVNTTGTPRGTPKRHVFCLEPVPSVGALRERAEEDEAAAAAAKANVNNNGDKGGNMITPPPTPPRREKEVAPDGVSNGEGEATPKRMASRRGSSSSAMTARTTTFGGAALGRSKSARTAPNTPMSKAGRADLGLGRPAGLSRHGSSESRDDICVLPNSPSMQIPKSSGRMTSPTKASFGFSGPTSAVDPATSTVSPTCADADASLSPASLSSVNSPVSSLLSNTSSFNARTASAQCRLMEGYVSFASIEGLGEPPASAHPSVGDAHSMLGDEDGDGNEREGGGKRFLGWILGK